MRFLGPSRLVFLGEDLVSQRVICWRHILADDAFLQLDLWDAVWREVVRGVICYWYAMYV
jgi:hypothetical protein